MTWDEGMLLIGCLPVTQKRRRIPRSRQSPLSSSVIAPWSARKWSGSKPVRKRVPIENPNLPLPVGSSSWRLRTRLHDPCPCPCPCLLSLGGIRSPSRRLHRPKTTPDPSFKAVAPASGGPCRLFRIASPTAQDAQAWAGVQKRLKTVRRDYGRAFLQVSRAFLRAVICSS